MSSEGIGSVLRASFQMPVIMVTPALDDGEGSSPVIVFIPVTETLGKLMPTIVITPTPGEQGLSVPTLVITPPPEEQSESVPTIVVTSPPEIRDMSTPTEATRPFPWRRRGLNNGPGVSSRHGGIRACRSNYSPSIEEPEYIARRGRRVSRDS